MLQEKGPLQQRKNTNTFFNEEESLIPYKEQKFRCEKQSIRKALEVLESNHHKLGDLFLQLDITSSGRISVPELHLAANHTGVQLNSSDYIELCQLLSPDIVYENPEDAEKSIDYRLFLRCLSHQSEADTPIFRTQKIWDRMALEVDKLEGLFETLQRHGETFLSFETLQECLYKCGLTLSTTDFAALKLELRQHTDKYGRIQPKKIVHALRQYENTVTGITSPRRSRTQRFFPDNAAGKTNKEINVRNDRSYPRMSDDHGVASTFQDVFLNDKAPVDTTPRPSLAVRIMQIVKRKNGLGEFSSLQTLFPSDRFGRIHRGLFRQSLVHIGVVARFAESEDLFWKLDPHGVGFITDSDLYRMLTTAASQVPADKTVRFLPPPIETHMQSARVHQRIIDSFLHDIPRIMAACKKIDSAQKGTVSKDEFIWALEEAGIRLSNVDANKAVTEISDRADGVVSYRYLGQRLENKCSELLSPRSKSKYLSMASAIIQNGGDEEEIALDISLHSPRRRGLPEYSQATIDLKTPTPKKVEKVEKNKQLVKPLSQKVQKALQQLRGKGKLLQNCFYQSTSSFDPSVSRSAVLQVLLLPRLGLRLDTEEAESLIRHILPPTVVTVEYDTFIKYLGLHVTPIVIQPDVIPMLAVEPARAHFKILRSTACVAPSALEVSVRRKVRQNRKLEALDTVSGHRTAGVVVRHAFRDTLVAGAVPTTKEGHFESSIRVIDLPRVCSRLNLELSAVEMQYLTSQVDASATGFIDSSALLYYLTTLVQCPTQTPISL